MAVDSLAELDNSAAHSFDLVAADSLEKLNNPAVHNFDRDELITVGELLDRVKWQSPQVNIQPNISSSNNTRTQDVSRN